MTLAASAASACGSFDATSFPATPDAAAVDGNTAAEAGFVDGGAGADATVEAASRSCSAQQKFEVPTLIAPLSDVDASTDDVGAVLSEDELTVFFTSKRTGSTGTFKATRAKRTDVFGGLSQVPLGSAYVLGSFTFGFTGIYVGSTTGTTLDLAYATYSGGAFGPFTPVVGIPGADAGNEVTPFSYTKNGRLYYTLLFPSRAHEATCVAGVCSAVRELDELGEKTSFPVASRDDRTLFYAQESLGGDLDIFQAERQTIDDPWTAATSVIATPGEIETPSWISADGCRLYLTSTVGGKGSHLYVANRAP